MWYKIGVWGVMAVIFAMASEKQGTYHKTYYQNGTLKSEGWLLNESKTGYWKFYHRNGSVAEQGHFQNDERKKYWYFYAPNHTRIKEGHYLNGKMWNWWLFYDSHGKINHKCQLDNGVKNGYCLKYRNEELTSVEKYKNGKKIKEWFDLDNFKSENKLSDLR